MRRNMFLLLALAGLVGLLQNASLRQVEPPEERRPLPVVPDLPKPKKVWGQIDGDPCDRSAPVVGGSRFVLTGPEHDQESITCDLPCSEHLRNGLGRDGLGLCVFTSLELAARWANEPALLGFRDFMTQHPGGGWPEKVDRTIPLMAQSKNLAPPNYVQHTGGDPEFLKLALKTGRYVCVTYSGQDGVLYPRPIAHMVNLVHLSEKWAVIQDNNFPKQWLWMPPADFLTRWKNTGGGWAIVLLKPGPPPIPINSNPVITTSPNGGSSRDSTGIDGFVSRNAMSGSYFWQPDKTHPDYLYLMKDGKQIGTWHPNGHGYRELQPDGTFGPRKDPPIPLPLPMGAVPNYGVDVSKLSGQDRYHLNGKEITRHEAFQAVKGLIDDSNRWRLTVVGPAPFRQQVLQDLIQHPQLKPFHERLLIQDYDLSHWSVSGVGFAPGITLQSAPDRDGRAAVRFRLPDYPGPETLAIALRKADPSYRPEIDPDPRKKPLLPFELSTLPPALWFGIGFVFLFLFKSKERS